jgi:hypothetical protein
VEHGQEHRPLDGELELPVAQLVFEHASKTQLAPESFDGDRGAYSFHGARAEAAGLVALDQADVACEAGERPDEAVDVALGLEAVEPPEGADDLLPDLTAVTEGLDDLEVLVAAGGLLADEHGRALPPPTTDTTLSRAARAVKHIPALRSRFVGTTFWGRAARTAPHRPSGADFDTRTEITVEDGLTRIGYHRFRPQAVNQAVFPAPHSSGGWKPCESWLGGLLRHYQKAA